MIKPNGHGANAHDAPADSNDLANDAHIMIEAQYTGQPLPAPPTPRVIARPAATVEVERLPSGVLADLPALPDTGAAPPEVYKKPAVDSFAAPDDRTSPDSVPLGTPYHVLFV